MMTPGQLSYIGLGLARAIRVTIRAKTRARVQVS